LFVIVRINPPMSLFLDKYLPSSSRNTIIQDHVEDSMDIEDQVNPMEEDDTNNIFETNDDDVDMVNPFNIDFETNEMDVDLDEEGYDQ